MITTTPEAMLAWGLHTYGSPLYHHLVEVIARDDELMRVMGRIEHLPQANLLFGAVHLLMMMGEGPELAAYYPSLVAEPLPLAGVGPVFREFVLAKEEEVVEIGNTRYTQTNECRRCVALLPIMMMAPFDSFHLVDIGTSAGLNLALDRYHYQLGDQEWGGDSGLALATESHGAPARLKDIQIRRRIGLDLNPIDPRDEDSRLWLDALIWPEHAERRARLRAALAMVQSLDIELVAGDALLTLPGILADLPEGGPVVVAHSYTLIQFNAEQSRHLDEIIQAGRSRRPVFRVSMEAIDKREAWARLDIDDGSGARTVGRAHPHGEWIELF